MIRRGAIQGPGSPGPCARVHLRRRRSIASWGDRMEIDPRRLGPLRVPGAAVLLAMLAAAALAPPARAADDIWQQDKLSGDWGGARTQLSQRGVDITINYIGETFA